MRVGQLGDPDQRSIRHWQFDAQDQLRGVRGLRARGLPTAALVLHRHVEALTALFVDLVQEWTPPPKQRLKRIRELNPAVAEAFDRLYALADLDEQMHAAERVVPRLFEMALTRHHGRMVPRGVPCDSFQRVDAA